MVMYHRPRKSGELRSWERPSDYPSRYCITERGETRLRKLGSEITDLLERNMAQRTTNVRLLRDFQNEQYMLAKLFSNPPLTRDEIISGGQETAMLISFNELLRRGWIEQS